MLLEAVESFLQTNSQGRAKHKVAIEWMLINQHAPSLRDRRENPPKFCQQGRRKLSAERASRSLLRKSCQGTWKGLGRGSQS